MNKSLFATITAAFLANNNISHASNTATTDDCPSQLVSCSNISSYLRRNSQSGPGEVALLWSPQGSTNAATKDHNVYFHHLFGKAESIASHNDFLVSSAGSKSVELGFNRYEGAMIVHLRFARGFQEVLANKNYAAGGVGGGWQSTIHDIMHHTYTPNTAGLRNNIGVPAKTQKSNSQKSFKAQQYSLATFIGVEFDFMENEPVTKDPQGKTVDWDLTGKNGQDEDGINETGGSVVDEARTEFDMSHVTSDASEIFGIPAFSQVEYYVYAREPQAIRQFVNAKTFNDARRILDISSGKEGNQTPADTDMSFLRFIHASARLRLPLDEQSAEIPFKYLLYRAYDENGEVVWRRHLIDAHLNDKMQECVFDSPTGKAEDPRNAYKYVSQNDRGQNRPVRDPFLKAASCKLAHPMMILSTNQVPSLGTGVAIYFPVKDKMNTKQTLVVNGKTEKIVTREDRRISGIQFGATFRDAKNPSLEEYGWYRWLNLTSVQYLSGMMAPSSVSQHYGPDHYEMITGKSYFLFGTPNEIMSAVEKFEASGQ